MNQIRHLMLVWATVIAMSMTITAQDVFINEFTYDYQGPEEKEFIEIFGPADTDLTDWTVTLYNGNKGEPYYEEVLKKGSGIKYNCTLQEKKYGVFMLNFQGDVLKNDGPVGIALANPKKEVQQFISYEGHFLAKSGIAVGWVSQDVGVSQNDDVDISTTIQYSGNWLLKKGTPGDCNEKQQIGIPLDCSIIAEALDCTGEKYKLSVVGLFKDYKWSTGESSASIMVNAGEYAVEVFTEKGESCKSSISLKPWKEMSCFLKAISPSCSGAKDGELHVHVNDGSGDFEYSIDGEHYQASNFFTDLSAGEYTVLVRDKNGPDCYTKCSAKLQNPKKLSCDIKVTSVSCFGAYNGILEVSATGGSGTYEYSLDGLNFTDSNTFKNLNAGTYIVTIKDAKTKGCTSTCEATIEQPEQLSVFFEAQDNSCKDSKSGTITVDASGGTAPYEYRLNNSPFQSGHIFTDLSAGTYTLTVQDANKCASTSFVVIGTAKELSCYLTIKDISCANEIDGQITVGATGGSGTYEYSIDNGQNFQTNPEFLNLSKGHYELIVRDAHANKCTTTCEGDIESPKALDLSVEAIPASCNGKPDGKLLLEVQGGTPRYTYSLNHGEFQENNNFTDLVAGTYTITVMDDKACEQSKTVELTSGNSDLELKILEIQPASSLDAADGTALVEVLKGQIPYTLYWEGVDVQDSMSVEQAGTVQIKDLKAGFFCYY